MIPCFICSQHHCRSCGMVVCNDCSNQKWPLPEPTSTPRRVCLTCYNRLSHSKKCPAFGGKQNLMVHPRDQIPLSCSASFDAFRQYAYLDRKQQSHPSEKATPLALEGIIGFPYPSVCVSVSQSILFS